MTALEVAFLLALPFALAAAWHFVQERVNGDNRGDINLWLSKLFGYRCGAVSFAWPVTKFHDRYIHQGVFAILLGCLIGWIVTGDPRFLDAAASIKCGDAIQHLGVFRREVAGWESAWGYAVVGFNWLIYRFWTGDGLSAAWLLGLIVFANLGYLATRHWLRKRA